MGNLLKAIRECAVTNEQFDRSRSSKFGSRKHKSCDPKKDLGYINKVVESQVQVGG